MLLDNPDLFNQDGVRRNVTIMFADLRGFTKICEDVAPEQVIAMLRDCFGKLISIVRANGGTIDKLIGDSLMVVWGNPVPIENHAERAVDSAIEMQAVMQGVKAKWKQKLGVEIMLGIGINTAEVVAGTIGTEEFCDYTVLGSGVNLASRLESFCPGGTVCVSEATYSLLKDIYTFSDFGTMTHKNNGGTVPVYQIVI
jgi:adenylate cyclase